MKVRAYNEIEDVEVSISFYLDKDNPVSIGYTHTCTKCGGYGCRHGNGPCNGGFKEIDLAKLDEIFSKEDVAKIKSSITDVYNKINAR